MTQPGNRPAPTAPAPSLSLRGAVDLSSLKKPAAPAGSVNGGAAPDAAPANGARRYAVDVNEASFQELIKLSDQVPVVVALGASYSPTSVELNQVLETIVTSYAGRLVLARVDAEVSPSIVQAFGATAIPTVVALLKGRPVPLFEGELPEEQIKAFFEELLKVAAANGVTGGLGGDGETSASEPAPLPPLHVKAQEAAEAGDFDAAAAAYKAALAEKPADAEAKAGLAQVELLGRTVPLTQADAEAVRTKAAQDPDDLEAVLSVADLDITGGHVEDALNRLVAFIGGHFGPERETVRVRLLDLFEVVGIADPRVSKARQGLARALF
ncbi:MAG: tetratricopeptide repeat protein [Acidobacteria bacterium]|nr:tetratricopeptide repeat protein [Acidobacteriota bacterium]